METKQKRYEQTVKGKQARQTAIIAYRARRVKWEVWLDREMSEELESSIPDGVSRSDYTRKIFCEYLDKVRCMIHTVEVKEASKAKIT